VADADGKTRISFYVRLAWNILRYHASVYASTVPQRRDYPLTVVFPKKEQGPRLHSARDPAH